MIKVAFDVYRQSLLRSLGLPLPDDLNDEKRVWGDFSSLFFRGGLPPGEELKYARPKT